MDVPDWPDQETVLALIDRFPQDAAAHADLLAAVYLPLLGDVQAAHPREDELRIADVVADLLIAFVKRPGQYDPARGSVRAYLKMAAGKDLVNARAKEARRKGHEIPLESVAEPAVDGKEDDEDDVRAWLAEPRVAAVIADFDATERRVWELMLSGDRTTAACAAVLGISDRPVAEQEGEVKRAKDRIKKRLKRAGESAA